MLNSLDLITQYAATREPEKKIINILLRRIIIFRLCPANRQPVRVRTTYKAWEEKKNNNNNNSLSVASLCPVMLFNQLAPIVRERNYCSDLSRW